MSAPPPSLLLRDHVVGDDVRRMAHDIADRHGDTVAAILFYGSCLRDESGAGILDFYVLVDDYRTFHGHRGAALANALVPPSVGFVPGGQSRFLGAKVAVIARTQFTRRLTTDAFDTTLWARFCQPVALAYCRDPESTAWVERTLSRAAATAVDWAVRLGPVEGRAEDFWTTLFRHTYAAELRVEGGGRAGQIYGFAPQGFDDAFARLSPPEVEVLADGRYRVHLDESERRHAQARWRRRRVAGKALNVLRLCKALFTFDGGVDYIVGKLERHSGQTIELRPWQRRHPLLAAPGMVWSLYRRGIIR